MTVYPANTPNDCRTGDCIVEDIVALFWEILELARVSQRRYSQSESGLHNTASFMCESMTFSGTQSHTERWGTRLLCKTPMRRSRTQVRLHNEIIDCAMSGSLFPAEIGSLTVHIIGLNCNCQFSWKLSTSQRSKEFGNGKLWFSLAWTFFDGRKSN